MIILKENERHKFRITYAAAGLRSAIFNKRAEVQGDQSWWLRVTGESCRLSPHRRVLALWMNSFPEISDWQGTYDPNDIYFLIAKDRLFLESHDRRTDGNDLVLYQLKLDNNLPIADYTIRVPSGVITDSGSVASRENYRRIPSLRHITLAKALVRSASPFRGG